MSLGTISLIIAALSAVLVIALKKTTYAIKNPWISFLQFFVGLLFLFSGAVKIVDPLGTAYKMEEYFSHFHSTFADAHLGFIAWIFPVLKSYSVFFSVVMIVFEIVLAIALLIGEWRKFSTWALLLLVLFFTALTGFTYLSGYVPEGVNFFHLTKWTSFDPSRMKVTDCGCFGDFIKLHPRTSFLKDVFLLVPAVLLLVRRQQMHQLFSPALRHGLMALAVIGSTVYGLSNFVWDIPDFDFRPFKEGVNIRAQREAESQAMAETRIVSWKLKNKSTGEIVEIPHEEYMKNYQKYPKSQWEVVDQIKTEPAIPITKISDFQVSDLQGNEVQDDLLNDPGYSLWIISYRLKGKPTEKEIIIRDSIFYYDTTWLDRDSFVVRRYLDTIIPRHQKAQVMEWDKDFVDIYTHKIQPVAEKLARDGVRVLAIIGGASAPTIEDFAETIGATYPLYEADDILLKTIIRSNPGLVLVKDGTILAKWHHRKFPSYEEIKEQYLKSH